VATPIQLNTLVTIYHVIVLVLLVLDHLHLPLQGRVKVVLYVVVSTTWKQLSYLRPPIPDLLVSLNYHLVLILRPLVLLYVRVQVIVPPICHKIRK